MENKTVGMKMRRRLLAAGLAAGLSLGGCFGSFNLSQSIWRWNRDASSSKWVQEVLFLALIIIPVYEVTLLVDSLVINSIEFWSGGPGSAARGAAFGEERIVRLEDGTELRMIRESEDTVLLERDGTSLRLRKEAGCLVALGEDGEVLARVEEGENGAIVRKDASGSHRIEAWEIGQAGTDPSSLLDLARQSR